MLTNINPIIIIYETPHCSGYPVSSLFLRFNSFKTKRQQILRYPTLFQVYNGPGSQKVTYEWKLNWDHYLSSYHDVVIIAVDGRGTGGRGDAFLHSIYRKLGTLEVDDQLAAAK